MEPTETYTSLFAPTRYGTLLPKASLPQGMSFRAVALKVKHPHVINYSRSSLPRRCSTKPVAFLSASSTDGSPFAVEHDKGDRLQQNNHNREFVGKQGRGQADGDRGRLTKQRPLQTARHSHPPPQGTEELVSACSRQRHHSETKEMSSIGRRTRRRSTMLRSTAESRTCLAKKIIRLCGMSLLHPLRQQRPDGVV